MTPDAVRPQEAALKALKKIITREGRGDRFIVFVSPGFFENLIEAERRLQCVTIRESEQVPEGEIMFARRVAF